MPMKPGSAPENGALVPLSRSRIAGTEPAPMKTSSAVPMNSAPNRCQIVCSSIAQILLLAVRAGGANRSPSSYDTDALYVRLGPYSTLPNIVRRNVTESEAGCQDPLVPAEAGPGLPLGGSILGQWGELLVQ